MLQNFKQKPRHIKLDKQFGIPSVKTLDEMTRTAMANAGATVELPFGSQSETLIITVSREVAKGSWLWMLYVDDGFGSKMDWSYITPDTSYINGLIANSHPDFLLKNRTASTAVIASTDNVEQPKLRKATLEGNLKNIQITNLLQSVGMGQMTGRLEVISNNDKAVLLFTTGKPIHAVLRGAEGNEAMIQLLGWEDGEFAFYDEPVDVTPTITRGLTSLIMEGAAFSDHYNFLLEKGVTHQSFPSRLREIASPADMKTLFKGGVDCDIELAWLIYVKSDGKTTWGALSRDIPQKKTEWVPVVFNLISLGIIRFDLTSVEVANAAKAGPQIDWSIVQTVRNALSRSDTGLYTYAALLYMLEQEYFRFEGFGMPCSVVMFGFCLKNGNPQHPQFVPLKQSAIAYLRENIFSIKRKYDSLCHYGTFGYAMVLPLTNQDNAFRFAQILADICANIDVSDEYSKDSIELKVGIGSIGEHCRTLQEMINACERVTTLAGSLQKQFPQP